MPLLSNSVPRYRKHRASGQAIVTLGGKDFYLGPHGTKASHLQYDRVIAEWLHNERTIPEPEAGLTVVELFAAYKRFAVKYYRKNGKPTPEVACILQAAKFVKDLYGRTEAADFGPLALQVVQGRMVDAGLSRNVINKACGRIKRIFKWGVAHQMIPPATWQALATVPGLRKGRTDARETAPVLPVDDATVDQTLPELPEVVADMVRFERLTGCRPSEVCNVRPCDIDTSGDVWAYRPESHKTEHHGRARIIFIGPRAQAVLRPYLLREKTSYCFAPQDSERKRRREQHENRQTPLQYGNRPGTNRKRKPRRTPGACYTKDSYRRAIQRACDLAGVPKWHPNQLRHSVGTELRKRYGIEAAQVALGHKDANVTEVYAERDLQKAADIMREVG